MGRHASERFLIRWLTSTLGLWVAAELLNGISYGNNFGVLLAAGFLLAIINSIIKPIVILLSLPALLFSLGLFMIVINGLMVSLLSSLYSRLDVASFWTAVLAGMVIGLVNYLVTTILEEK